MTEDLDWTGLSTANYVVETFSGVLDGRGHSIKGFTLGIGAAAGSYHTCLIHTNNGTIQNLGFDYAVTAAGGESYSGLVVNNSGTIQNLFVKATFASYTWTTGAIAGYNNGTGTVRNCITAVSSSLSDQPAKNRLGSIVGSDFNGKIINCYSVNTENSIATPYLDTWNNGTYTGNAVYADNAAMLTAVTTLPAGDGWGTCWAVTAEGITFGEELVIAGQTEPDCEHEDASPVDGKCDLCGEDVALPEGTYLINSATVATAGSLSALINADLDGTYYVTEDLTLGSEAGIGAFTGTLDGQGHSLKGIVINMNSNGGYESTVIASNSGTIENKENKDEISKRQAVGSRRRLCRFSLEGSSGCPPEGERLGNP